MFSLLLTIIYLAFISLGLPDALLGSAWPSMYTEFNVPVSYSGIIFSLITVGTIFSTLMSDALIKKLGTPLLTSLSTLLSALCLFGFYYSHSFLLLCILSIPYGLGAGSIDAAINNYVALHYKSKHMNWLHAMWGLGASIGPYIMSYALSNGKTWNAAYLNIGLIQLILGIIVFLSIPLWIKDDTTSSSENTNAKALSIPEILNIKETKAIMLTFFCYCALEQCAGLWASTYLVIHKGVSVELAAGFATLFFTGITIGRIICGFLSIKFSDKQMIRAGEFIILFAIILLFLPITNIFSLLAFLLIGAGCAPVYPALIHLTPKLFGKDKSSAIIGLEMSVAYLGILIMPSAFGFIAKFTGISFLAIFLFIILILMCYGYEKVITIKK